MKKLPIVFTYEFLSMIKKKAFITVTIVMTLILVALSFIPTIISHWGDQGKASQNGGEIKYGIVYLTEQIAAEELVQYPPFDHVKVFESEAALNHEINEGTLEAGVVITDLVHFNYIVQDEGMRMQALETFNAGLKLFNRDQALKKANVSLEAVNEADNIVVYHEVQVLGKSSAKNLPMAYLGMLLMYILTISYGAHIAGSVAKEKSNRTMELLITSCDPTSLIVGKVLATASTILIQVFIFALGIMVGIKLNQGSFPVNLLDGIRSSINVGSVSALLIFGILGFLMYAFLFAAMGALVSKIEDVNASTLPITLIFLVSYFIATFGMSLPDNMVFKVASLVPFTAPLCMFVRNTLTSVPVLEVIISALLVGATTVGLAWLSIKIYRMGTLNYGNKIGLIKAIKMVFSK